MKSMETEKCDISFYNSICNRDLTLGGGNRKIGSNEIQEMELLILPRNLQECAKFNTRYIYDRYYRCIG